MPTLELVTYCFEGFDLTFKAKNRKVAKEIRHKAKECGRTIAEQCREELLVPLVMSNFSE
jgi:hypothetical protein